MAAPGYVLMLSAQDVRVVQAALGKLLLEVSWPTFDRIRAQVAQQDADADKAAVQHAASCAVNNGPAYPAGPCDCGAKPAPE